MKAPVTTLLVLVLTMLTCVSQNKVGESFLDDYIKATAISRARDVSEKKMLLDLEELDKRASSLRGEVPEGFVVRFRRLIEMTRIAVSSERSSENRMKVLSYIKSLTGVEPPESEFIPAAADAFFKEISLLRALFRK